MEKYSHLKVDTSPGVAPAGSVTTPPPLALSGTEAIQTFLVLANMEATPHVCAQNATPLFWTNWLSGHPLLLDQRPWWPHLLCWINGLSGYTIFCSSDSHGGHASFTAPAGVLPTPPFPNRPTYQPHLLFFWTD